MTETTRAHANDWQATRFNPDGNAPWRDAVAPDIASGRTTGRLKGCSFCGSMHPADLAAAIRAGATMSLADMKYGWPHKAYVSGVPNPHAGMLESLSSKSHPPDEEKASGAYIEVPGYGFDQATGKPNTKWTAAGTPAPATVGHAKFYTIHLQDASPEDREAIEHALGLTIAFNDVGGIHWAPVGTLQAETLLAMPATEAQAHAAEQRRAAAMPQQALAIEPHPAVAAMQPLDNDGNAVAPSGRVSGTLETMRVETLGDEVAQRIPVAVVPDPDDFKLGPACDLSGEGPCEGCQ